MALMNMFGDNDNKDTPEGDASESSLVSWVMGKVERGRDVRDEAYEEIWKEYTRLWRGFWVEKDKNSNSERSRIIAPALQQAIDSTVAEIEEAVFSQKAWFDIDDDLYDENKEDALQYRDQLLEDFELQGVPDQISVAFLNGALYGTGIALINVQEKNYPTVEKSGAVTMKKQVCVTLDAIRPDEFVIDPASLTVEDALYVAVERLRPLHSVKMKQKQDIYKKGHVGSWSSTEVSDPTGTSYSMTQRTDEGALITEYFGKVPAYLLNEDEDMDADDIDEGSMVEAIVTIANESVLLRATANPFTHKDRPIVAYQHDTVPGQFWGRGVSEKGYNPQKALDAEMRARMDALALITAPMMGADITRLPRNPDLRVRPGKTILTRGRPSEIVEPIGFSAQALGAQFQQTGELERMVQMGTGAMDTATPNNISRRNETTGGMSMMLGSSLKKAKRTMHNIERNFLDKIVQKSLWRYMQFDPQRYPADYKFIVNSTMGMMAKEAENSILTQMLGFVPPESPGHKILVQAIFENTVSDKKKALHQAIQAMNQPPDENAQKQQQALQEAQFKAVMLENAKLEAEIAEIRAVTALKMAEAKHEAVLTDLEDDKLEIAIANAVTGAEKANVARQQIQVASERNKVELVKAKMGKKTPTQ